MALPLPPMPVPCFADACFAVEPAPAPPVLRERDSADFAAGFFVAPRAGDAAARAFAGAFLGIDIFIMCHIFCRLCDKLSRAGLALIDAAAATSSAQRLVVGG